MWKYNNKDVLVLRWRARIDEETNLGWIWDNYSRQDFSLYPYSKKQLQDIIKAKRTSLTNNEVLFFGATSKFPRFKLSESNFKRCIKVDKATRGVVGEFDVNEYTFAYMFEDEMYVYAMQKEYVNSIYSRLASREAQWIKDPIEYIKDHNLFYGSKINELKAGPFCACDKKSGKDLDMILDGSFKAIITDEDLDKAISTSLESFTEEDVTAICDLLDSPDKSTKEVGLKMLVGYNVAEIPVTMRLILGARLNDLYSLPAWHSVGVQQVLKSVNFTGGYTFPNYMYNISKPNEKISELDIKLGKAALINLAEKYISAAVANVNDAVPAQFGIKVNYEIS